MTKKTRNRYNHYTENFHRADDPNISSAEVAKELGIHLVYLIASNYL